MKLIYEATGVPVRIGDLAKTFRGEEVTVTAIQEPRHSGSTGRVGISSGGREDFYYPGVINAVWIDRTDL